MEDKPAVPERLPTALYKDVVSPAAREVGTTLGRAVKAALAPANFVIRTVEEVIEFAQEAVEKRFERWKTDAGKVASPPPEIAGPVLQALRFPNQDPTLRELYLNLLATAMLTGEQEKAHPAFAEVLRQLSPLEARILPLLPTLIAEEPFPLSIPLLEIRQAADADRYLTRRKHVTNLGAKLQPPTMIPASAIDNLVRLGILSVHEMHHPMPDELYRELQETKEARLAAESIAPEAPSYHRYLAEVTAFGQRFISTVVHEPKHDAT